MDIKIIIAGSRNFNDYPLLKTTLDTIIGDRINIEIVSGNARGADALGEKYAAENNIKIQKFIPDWENLGKSAGFVRNKEMAIYSNVLIAFWDQKSLGTAHMIQLAKKYKLKTRVICY